MNRGEKSIALPFVAYPNVSRWLCGSQVCLGLVLLPAAPLLSPQTLSAWEWIAAQTDWKKDTFTHLQLDIFNFNHIKNLIFYSTHTHIIPEWTGGSAGGLAELSGPTQQGLFYDLGWKNESQPSLLLDHIVHLGHPPPSRVGPFLLLPETDYRTGHLGRRTGLRLDHEKTDHPIIIIIL